MSSVKPIHFTLGPGIRIPMPGDDPERPRPVAMVVMSVDRETGVVTFGHAPEADPDHDRKRT